MLVPAALSMWMNKNPGAYEISIIVLNPSNSDSPICFPAETDSSKLIFDFSARQTARIGRTATAL